MQQAATSLLTLVCCRYWSDPQVLSKLSAAMGDTFDPAALAAANGGGEGEEQEEEEEGDMDVHGAASAGMLPRKAARTSD